MYLKVIDDVGTGEVIPSQVVHNGAKTHLILKTLKASIVVQLLHPWTLRLVERHAVLDSFDVMEGEVTEEAGFAISAMVLQNYQLESMWTKIGRAHV